MVDECYEDELIETVKSLLPIASQSQSSTNDFLVGEMLRLLCGPEPLATDELLRFLDATAGVVRSAIQQAATTRIASQSQPASSDAATSIIMNAEVPTQIGTKEASPASIDFQAAYEAPSLVLARLAALDALERSEPQRAHWYQLCEFTAVTENELARYLNQPLKLVSREVLLAKAYVNQAEILTDVTSR